MKFATFHFWRMLMIEFRADLHCHTTCSDGSATPQEVVKLALEIGLQGLSITDHDTIEAYEVLEKDNKKIDLKLLSGIEFSTIHRGSSVHVLAYAFDLKNVEINNLCKSLKTNRVGRMEEMIHLLKKQGIVIDEKELFNNKNTIGRPHLAEALVKQKYAKSIQDAFNLFLGDGKCCFVPSNSMSTEETIEIIKRAKGFSIIAHPHIIKNPSTLTDILNMDFDGIEAYYARFSSQHEKTWIEIAKKKDWIMTGGSDYHGKMKPNNALGCSWVDAETFNRLYARYEENMRVNTVDNE